MTLSLPAPGVRCSSDPCSLAEERDVLPGNRPGAGRPPAPDPEPSTARLPLRAPSGAPARRPDRSAHHPDRSAIDAVRESFWLLGNVADLEDLFDRHLLLLAPRAEGALNNRRQEGSERLVTALLRPIEAVGAAGECDQAIEQLHAVGSELAASGMATADLTAVGHALARAARDTYTEEWTTCLGSSWSAVQEWVVEHLLPGARSVRPAPGRSGRGSGCGNDRAELSTIDLTGLNSYHPR
ncbi:MAG: hypothetical protein QG608_996 [Actinomycetota bacterium]|nr:hypothetical protein [Actinomycetota bacterium]